MDVRALCQSALAVLTVATAAFWIGAGFMLVRGLAKLANLAGVEPLPDAELPSLAIAVTAKDEARRVEAAARSLLAQNYPRLEVLIVNDRSVDETGAILDRLASQYTSLKILHVDALPDGWIGKSHALAKAAASTRSEWILFTDGDIEFAPDAARRAVTLALRAGADHLAIAPDLILESIGEAVFVAYFVIAFDLSQRPWAVADPASNRSIGIGAFNLVRREAYERAGGHEAIRFDLVDDLGLGKILKRSGARQLFALHGGKIRATWHAGTRGLIRGVEKNAFAAFRYRALPALAAVAGQLIIGLVPIVGFFLPGANARIASAVSWLGIASAYAAVSRSLRIRPWQAALMPFGALLFSYAILRSTWMTLARGGVSWRGTFYPLGQLRRKRVW